MSQLSLWGHYTLVYFLSLWFILNASVAWFKNYDAVDLKSLGLTFLAALALSAGFPPYPLAGTCFIGFALFFVHRHKAFSRGISRYAYNWQLFSGLWLWNILTTFWVENTLFFSGLIANVLNALLMMIPFVLWNRIERFVPSRWFRYFAFIAFWISYEYLHLNWEISWPWLILGHQFAHVPQLIQWYEFSGVLGGSLWILIINFTIYEWWRNHPKKQNRRPIIIGILVIAPIVYSLVRFYTYKPRGEKAEVVVLQGNYNPHYAKDTVPQERQMEKYLQLSQLLLTDSTRWLLLPESSFRGLDMNNLLRHQAVSKFNSLMGQFPNTATIMGASIIERWYDEKPQDSRTLREYEYENGKRFWWKAYNAAVFLQDQKEPEVYKKSKFVPGAEITPYPKVFFFLKPLTDALGGSIEGLGTQKDRIAFHNGSLSMAPVICYESVYGEFSSRYVSQGQAQALGIVTIDGWWDETAGHLQHLYLGALRAIEFRRDIARSAVTGISGFIDQRGVVWKRSIYEETAALKADIYFNDSRTFYSIWGDMIGRLSAFFMVLSLIYAFRNFLMERNG